MIVRQGDTGRTSFLVARGVARVSLAPDDQEVARLGVGEVFGEMSWLTGEPRSATVTAAGDTVVFELDDDVLRELATASAGVLDTLAEAVSRRRHELDSISADTAHRQPQVGRATRLARRPHAPLPQAALETRKARRYTRPRPPCAVDPVLIPWTLGGVPRP